LSTSVTETCDLCPDGSTPLNGDKVVPGFDAEPTCSDLVTVREIDGNATCEAATSVLAAYCGCEGVVGCSLCPEGSIVEDPDRVELLHFQSCAFWEAQAQIQRYPDACDDLEVEFSYSAFCCSGVEAPNMCSFCGDSGLSDETRVVFDDVTCGDLDTQAAFLLEDTICTKLQSSYASFCCQSDTLNGTEDPVSPGPIPPSAPLILPNEQVCSGFTATEIDFDASSATKVDTIATSIEYGCDRMSEGFNKPSLTTVTIVAVADTDPLAVYTRPGGLVIASVSLSGTLSFSFSKNLSASDTREAGVIVEMPQSQLTSVRMDGVDEIVQILGDFPALGSIIDSGVSNSLQANLTSSTGTMYYEASGANGIAKIESLISDIDLILSGVNMDIEIAGNVGSCELSGGGNVLLLQGSIESVAADGVNNEVRINDASGVGCDPFPAGDFVMDTCSITSETVSLIELPCVSSTRNIVCSWLEMGVGSICYCRESFEGVPVETNSKATASPTQPPASFSPSQTTNTTTELSEAESPSASINAQSQTLRGSSSAMSSGNMLFLAILLVAFSCFGF
jgi:hypothetical protein